MLPELTFREQRASVELRECGIALQRREVARVLKGTVVTNEVKGV